MNKLDASLYFPYFDRISLYEFPAARNTTAAAFISWREIDANASSENRMDDVSYNMWTRLQKTHGLRTTILHETRRSHTQNDSVEANVKLLNDTLLHTAQYVENLNFMKLHHPDFIRLWHAPVFVWAEMFEDVDVVSEDLAFEACQILSNVTLWSLGIVREIFVGGAFEAALECGRSVQRMWKYFGKLRVSIERTTQSTHTVDLAHNHFHEMLQHFILAQNQEVFIMGVLSKCATQPASASLLSKLCNNAVRNYVAAKRIFATKFETKHVSLRFLGDDFKRYCREKMHLFDGLGRLYQAYSYAPENDESGLPLRIACVREAQKCWSGMEEKVHTAWLDAIAERLNHQNDVVYFYKIPAAPERLEEKAAPNKNIDLEFIKS